MLELASLVLTLRPTHQDTIPGNTGRATHAWFLASLRDIGPDLAAIVHNRNGPKPFTTSGLVGTGSHELITLHPAGTYKLRITTLHRNLTQLTLNELLPRWLAHGITLHDQPFRVEQISTDAGEDPWAGATNYADLVARHTHSRAQRSHSQRIRLHFASPTAFNKTGGLQVPLPIPELVFGSLLDRWAAFSSVALEPELRQFITEHVAVSEANIHTRRVSFERSDRGAVTGFVGDVSFSIPTSDRHLSAQLHMLAEFARYSGIGVRTTMGLGQTKSEPATTVADRATQAARASTAEQVR